ncbi:MAG: MBL fold metallo-hydrolase [Desulfatiglandales bacterium]
MRISVLASGSSGNACYVETDQTRIIVDAGLSGKELTRRLELIKVDPKDIDALVITHEHADHIKGAGPLARRFHIPVYINGATLRRGMRSLGNISRPVILQTGRPFAIHDLSIETFTKCHDAADPIGLVLSSNGSRLGIITDLGRSTHLVTDRLKHCQALVIEFNHDEKMLAQGPYPMELKRRIRGSDGHLSNRQAGQLLRSVTHSALNFVVLAHISDANNDPEMALEEAERVLEECGQQRTRIFIGRQDQPLPPLDF